jgi:PAS domain S-box-containing protein
MSNKTQTSPHQIDRKIALSFGAVVLVLILTATGVASDLFLRLQKEEEDRLVGAITAILSESISQITFSGKYHARLLVEDMLARVPELAYIAVVNNDGSILAHSDPALNDTEIPQESAELSRRSLQTGVPVLSEFRAAAGVVKEVIVPYKGGFGSEVVGTVHVGVRVENARTTQQINLLKLLVLVAVLTSAAIAAVYFLSRRFGGTMTALGWQLQGILGHAPLGIIISDSNGNLLASSAELERIVGRVEGNPSLSAFLSHHLPETNSQALLDMERRVFQKSHKIEQEMIIETRGMRGFWNVSKFPIATSDAGRVTLSCTLIQDITKRKRAEQALRDLEKNYREMVEYAPIGIFQSTPQGRYLLANKQFAAMFGYNSVQDLIENVSDISSQMYMERDDREDVLRCLEHGPINNIEGQRPRKDGSLIWTTMSLRTVRDLTGNVLHYEGFVSDITERKNNEERLSSSLREKEVLLKEVHHRVKNNLQIISSLLNLQATHISNPEVEMALKESQSRVRSMAAIHEELYRSENFSQIDLEHYIKFFVPRLATSYNINKRTIGLDFDLSYTLVTIDQAIPFALILNELVTNAIRHGLSGRDDGRIGVGISSANDMITVWISDNGNGLPEGFDLKKAASLGMHLVTALANQLHGAIHAENQNGAVFTLVFPAA